MPPRDPRVVGSSRIFQPKLTTAKGSLVPLFLNLPNLPSGPSMLPVAKSPFADYAAVKDYLVGLKTYGVKFGIDRMRLLVGALGHPEQAYPTIHLAGTNGKGSVAAML